MTARDSAAPTDRYAFPINDACLALGIKRTSLYDLAKKGQLKLIKIAGRTLVPRSEIERLTKERDEWKQKWQAMAAAAWTAGMLEI